MKALVMKKMLEIHNKKWKKLWKLQNLKRTLGKMISFGKSIKSAFNFFFKFEENLQKKKKFWKTFKKNEN